MDARVGPFSCTKFSLCCVVDATSTEWRVESQPHTSRVSYGADDPQVPLHLFQLWSTMYVRVWSRSSSAAHKCVQLRTSVSFPSSLCVCITQLPSCQPIPTSTWSTWRSTISIHRERRSSGVSNPHRLSTARAMQRHCHRPAAYSLSIVIDVAMRNEQQSPICL